MSRLFTPVSIGKPYSYDVKPNPNYSDFFGCQLTDGQLTPNTGVHYTDARMVGFTAPTTFIVDLGDDGKRISALSARSLCMSQDGVGTAFDVIFSGSEDGENFEELGTVEFKTGLEKTVSVAYFKLDEIRDFRYIRYKIRPREGFPFFFIDELCAFADVHEKEKEDRVAISYANENIDRSSWKNLSTKKVAKPFSTENAAVGKKYTFENCIFDERAPKNDVLLTDGAHIGGIFGENVWVGISGKTEKTSAIVIDLESERDDIFAVHLHTPDEVLNIVHPDYIDCLGSLDGKNYTFIGRIYAPVNSTAFSYSLQLPEYIKARFIRFEFSKGDGFYWFEEIEIIAGSDEEIHPELYQKVFYPKITKDIFWNPNDEDFHDTQNLLLGLPQQIDASFYVDKYARGGNETSADTTVLTDGKSAKTADDCFYSHGGESLDFFYDIGHLSAIEKLCVHLYENNERSLPRPDHIHIFLSDDATNWFKVAVFDRPWHQVNQIKKTKEFVFDGAEKLCFEFPLENAYAARFVRFRIELENGLLMDELEAFGKKDISSAIRLCDSNLPSVPFYTNPEDEHYLTVENCPIKANDIALIYYGATSGDALLPFVAYLDEDGNIKDTFMDGYLYLPTSPLPSGRFPYSKTWINDWEFICDNTFTCDCGLDRLEAVVEQVKVALNKPDYKVQVYMSIPEVVDEIEDFGDVDGDGIIESLEKKEDRAKVFKWYIDRCLKKYNERNYKNLEFGGFYWFNEQAAWLKDDSHIIREAADAVHAAGTYFLWIPYYVAHRYFLGFELGFDFVSMQPNYAFKTDHPFYRIPTCAQYTKQRGYTVEIEHTYQALGDPIFARRYMLYLYYGALTGYMNSIHAYYDDRENIGLMGYSKDLLCRMQYDATYKFAKHILDVIPEPKETLAVKTKSNEILRSNLNENGELSIYTLVESPENGSVSLNTDGKFAYYPAKGFKGKDRFAYTYNKFLGESEICYVEIAVE